jgi:CheY-like chemotaxis protein
VNDKRVLLVDDDQDFLEVNRLALQRAGFNVLTACDGEEGFRIATEQPVDVAVLDVMMADRDEGFALARRMRQDTRSSRIPLLMLTSINADNRARGFAFSFSERDRDETWLPIDRFIDKPVTGERLVDLVRELSR